MKIKGKDIARLRVLVGEGLTPDEMIERTGWDEDKLVEVREELFAQEEINVVGRRTEDVYVDYVVKTRANIRLLDEILEDLRMTKQGSAMVGAVKAKQDLFDRVLNRGQEFGFIEKRPERSQIGILVAKLDDAALGELLIGEITSLRSMMTVSGSTPFLEVVEEGKALPLPSQRKSKVEPSEFSPPPRDSILDETPSHVVRKKASPHSEERGTETQV
jgi:hypothetical protein